MVTVASFPAAAQAEALRTHLEARGVECEVRGQLVRGSASVLPDLSERHSIWVSPEDFHRAMDAVISADLLEYCPWVGVACPECQSLKVERVKSYFKDVSWGYFLFSLFLLGLPLYWRRFSFHCVDCGALWRP